jgi:hypothetical protein
MGQNNSVQQVQPPQACCDRPTPFTQPMQQSCPYYHSLQSQGGLDYPWLVPSYGQVVKAEFNENNQGWIDYSQLHMSTPNGPLHNWWVEHCSAVSHSINNLSADHIATFVTPATRTIIMRLIFDDGRVYQSDMDMTVFRYFFILEETYAKQLVALELP